MTTAPGWYSDPYDARTMRFWNGEAWTTQRCVAEAVPTSGAASAMGLSSASAGGVRLSWTPTAWLVFGGAAVAAIGTLLPWEQDTTAIGTHVTTGPSSVAGAAVLLLGLLAAAVWIAWPSREGSLSKARRVGLAAIAAVLTFFVLAKLQALGAAQSQLSHDNASLSSDPFAGSMPTPSYGPGAGLFVFGAGVAAIWVGIARAWLTSRRRSTLGT